MYDDAEFDLSGPASEMFEMILLEAVDATAPPSKIELPIKQVIGEIRAVYPDLPNRALGSRWGAPWGESKSGQSRRRSPEHLPGGALRHLAHSAPQGWGGL